LQILAKVDDTDSIRELNGTRVMLGNVEHVDPQTRWNEPSAYI